MALPEMNGGASWLLESEFLSLVHEYLLGLEMCLGLHC